MKCMICASWSTVTSPLPHLSSPRPRPCPRLPRRWLCWGMCLPELRRTSMDSHEQAAGTCSCLPLVVLILHMNILSEEGDTAANAELLQSSVVN